MSWFDTARFGLFVHWSHSSQRGVDVSWPLVGGVLSPGSSIPVDEYHSTAATFDPQAWDAVALAQQAKRLNMRYAVFTTKHHDGYAMFHTKQSDFSVAHSPVGRDLVREFADAMRAEGLRVGFYFSLIDWHHRDYPAFTDDDKPYTLGKWRQPEPEAWERYIDFMFGQIRELLTNYGTIDLLWFDGGWERTAEQWQSERLNEMIRELQPEIVINDRLPGVGDFVTPERFVPAQAPEGAWETCMTMNESWGYNPSDTRWKSARQLIHTLCEVAGRGGNLLLNVGPMGDGRLQPEALERFAEIERWMARHAESIIDTTPGLESWQFYGPSTSSGDRIYVHLLMRPYDTVSVRGVHVRRLRSVRSVSTGAELKFEVRSTIIDSLFNRDPLGEVTIQVPDDQLDANATVLALDFAEAPL